MAGRDVTDGEGLPPGEQAKLRFYFISGSLLGGLGVLALAAGEFGTGTPSLVIGLAALMLGVKRGQALTAAIAGQTKAQAQPKTKTQTKTKTPTQTKSKTRTRTKAEAAPYSAWYTVGLGLILMGAGAATTVFARDAETRTTEIVLFLLAGVLLWMGVTSVIAARLKARRGDGASPGKGRPGRQRAG